MNKDTVINLRVNNKLKDDFQNIVSEPDFTMSEVLEAFMKDVVRRGRIPIYVYGYIKPKVRTTLSIPYIKKCLEEIIAKSKDKKIKTASLFGSYSTGKATASSDVDIYIETEKNFSLFDLTTFKSELENKLGKKVDLITEDGDKQFIHHIFKEKIQLYEKESS